MRLEVPQLFSPSLADNEYSPEQAALIDQLPPPSHIVRLTRAPWRPGTTVASASVKSAERGEPEQFPFVYEAYYRKRNVLAVGARGLWRWDFWPVSQRQEEASGSFADFLLECAERLARSNANQALYVYPDQSPCRETDSLALRFVLPQGVATDTTRLRLTLCRATADTVLDTTIVQMPYAGLNRRMMFAPVGDGAYLLRCTAATAEYTAAYADSLRVNTDDSELRVREQNRLLLDQFALPLDPTDSIAVAAFLHSRDGLSRVSATETRHIPIRQSWPLLLALIALFCSEWFLRKFWRVE
jgi:hypothetical protein